MKSENNGVQPSLLHETMKKVFFYIGYSKEDEKSTNKEIEPITNKSFPNEEK